MNDQLTLKKDSSYLALVLGQPIKELPHNLYIPPDALKVFLEQFEGPLDLLLYLIRKQNIDILDIPIAPITKQYIDYIDLMEEMSFDLASEYLVMAAILAEIKSKMLLPKAPSETEDEDEDPRAELIRRLQEYERYKRASEELDAMPRRGRDNCAACALVIKEKIDIKRTSEKIEINELMYAFKEALERAALQDSHHVQLEPLSVKERMSQILESLNEKVFLPFSTFFKLHEGRMGVVVTFVAILELFKNAKIEVVQAKPFAPIYVKERANIAEVVG